MENSLARVQYESFKMVPAHIEEVMEQAHDYINHAKAFNTVKSYRSDWNDFTSWCEMNNQQSLPASPQTLALYLTAMAQKGYKTSTLQRRISAISQAHKAANYETPTKTNIVHTVWAGIRRMHGTQQQGKAPAVIDDIRAMVDTLSNSNLGVRDRTLLLIGFAGAFRRSELVSLDYEDIEFTREGIVVNLRKSKTDQEGQGRKIGIPFGSHIETCPVRSLREWLNVSAIKSGPLFRPINRHGQIQQSRLSDKAVAIVVKRCAEAAGLDAQKYAGHSLRAGLATTAANAGVSERVIMAQTGHKSVNMVRKYIREGSLFKENAAASIGL